MRHWLPLALWFFAWSFWASLGIGLYHELPRDLGRPFRKLPAKELECLLAAFVPDTKLVAFERTPEDGRSRIVVFDAETGASREFTLSDESNAFWMPNGNPMAVRRHGIVFDASKTKTPVSRRDALEIVDLRDGSRRTLVEGAVGGLAVHSERPWVALVQLLEPNRKEQRVLLLDFRTGERLFEGPRTRVCPFGELNLYEDSNCIAVPVERIPGGPTTDPITRREYWRLDATPTKVTWEEALGKKEETDRPAPAGKLPSLAESSHPPGMRREAWRFEQIPWLRDWYLETVSFRDSDGHLICRVRAPAQKMLGSVDSAGKLLVDDDGNVYRLPPPANWLLLALCQAILALPLVLLWAALRWRRKRQVRMASVAP